MTDPNFDEGENIIMENQKKFGPELLLVKVKWKKC